ncbi:MAG: response regulator transcription factor [Lautropia sp.]
MISQPPSGSRPPPGKALKVLVVEDETTIAANLHQYLELRGFVVDVAYDGPAAISRAAADTFDAIVLDLGLPRADGFQVLDALRRKLLRETPVLILTARGELETRLRGLEAGADDYLTKPFALAEVEARLLALHRRAVGAVVVREIRLGPLRLDRRTRELSVADRPLRLMPRSMQLLERLLREPGAVVPRRELERLLWPDDDVPPDALRSQIYLLRRSLAEAGFDGLETVHGVGFRLRG